MTIHVHVVGCVVVCGYQCCVCVLCIMLSVVYVLVVLLLHVTSVELCLV